MIYVSELRLHTTLHTDEVVNIRPRRVFELVLYVCRVRERYLRSCGCHSRAPLLIIGFYLGAGEYSKNSDGIRVHRGLLISLKRHSVHSVSTSTESYRGSRLRRMKIKKEREKVEIGWLVMYTLSRFEDMAAR